jgi:purine-nucleoside phosphorylase
VFGQLEGRPVLVVQGRAHYYEGHAMEAVRFPVRLAHALGTPRLLLTNAAGGVNPAFGPGTLMLITDHLNLAFPGPLGIGGGEGPRAASFSGSPYSAAWLDRAEATALGLGVPTRKGVYVWASGPSYETPAEIRFFQRAGADAVGMSTVPEALQAAALGMEVLGISTITNPAAGLSATPLNHEEVMEVGRSVRERLAAWVRGIVRELGG